MYHHNSPELRERFLKRLEGTEGNVKKAAESVGVPVQTIRNWRHRDKEFDKQCRVVVEKARGEMGVVR